MASIAKISKKNPLVVFTTVILVFVLVRFIFFYATGFVKYYSVQEHYLRGIAILLHGLQFESIAIGGISAFMLLQNSTKWLQFIYRIEIQILNIGLILFLLYRDIDFYMFENIVYGVLFSVFILNVSSNSKTLLRLNNKPLNYLGKISYGLYAYHSIVLTILIKYFDYKHFSALTFNIFLYSNTFIFTILLASMSYFYFEKFFLKYKKRFTIIESTS